MQIISEIKIDGKWVNQDLIPKETVAKIVERTILEAVKTVGFEATKKQKTA